MKLEPHIADCIAALGHPLGRCAYQITREIVENLAASLSAASAN